MDKVMVNINKEEVGIINRLWRECCEYKGGLVQAIENDVDKVMVNINKEGGGDIKQVMEIILWIKSW